MILSIRKDKIDAEFLVDDKAPSISAEKINGYEYRIQAGEQTVLIGFSKSDETDAARMSAIIEDFLTIEKQNPIELPKELTK